MRLSLVVIITALLAIPLTSYACEPCPPDRTQDLEGTIDKADLIAIVTLDEPVTGEGKEGEPQQIILNVVEVLKGTPHGDDGKVVAHSWSGMCPYGIIIAEDDEREHLVLLRWKESTEEYDAVGSGCSIKGGPFVDGKVVLPGKSVPRDNAAEALGLSEADDSGSSDEGDGGG